MDKKSDLCLCPSNPIPVGGGTPYENVTVPENKNTTEPKLKDLFLGSYSTSIQNLQEVGAIEVVESPTDLQEGQNVECGNTTQKFESLVFSDMRVNLTSLTVSETLQLEQGFKTAYNQLAFQICDGLFRQVELVELRLAPTEYEDDSANAEEGNSVGRRLQDILQSSMPTYMNATNTSDDTLPLYSNGTINTTAAISIEDRRSSVVPVLFR